MRRAQSAPLRLSPCVGFFRTCLFLARLFFDLLRLWGWRRFGGYGRCQGDRRRFGGMLDDRRNSVGRRYRITVLDLGPTRANQPFVGGDKRHVWIDEHPAGFGWYLHVKMQMIGRAALFFVV